MAERFTINPALRAEVVPALNNRAAFEFNPDLILVATPGGSGGVVNPGGGSGGTGSGTGSSGGGVITPQPRVRVQPGDLITADLINFILARLDALESIKQPDKLAAADKAASADKTFDKSAVADKGIEKINLEKAAAADKSVEKIVTEKALVADKIAAAEKVSDTKAADKSFEKATDTKPAEKLSDTKPADKSFEKATDTKPAEKLSDTKAGDKSFEKASDTAGGIVGGATPFSGGIVGGINRPQKSGPQDANAPSEAEDAVDPATGRAFIRPEERPHVEKKAVDRASETEEPEEPATPGPKPKPRRKKPSARRPR
ncbi:MAG: hypothetical protein AABO41_17100 [Acidobacteriota bacterium]